MMRRVASVGGGAVPCSVSPCLCAEGISPEGSFVAVQRRFSFKYATKLQHDEMRQPFYIHEKRYGIFSNEKNIRKSRRGLPFITPLYTKHMNLWETDTDASNNRFFRGYYYGQRELHELLGRPHSLEAANADGSNGLSAYEAHTNQLYKGMQRPAIANLHYEPTWRYTLYQAGAHGAQLSNPQSPLTANVLGDELMQLRDIKSVEHCKAWFDRLQYLINLHYDAVGDIGEFKSRHTRHVHEFFVTFHDALSSLDFRDTYLFEQFNAVRPPELSDIFGIFIEMEANSVHEDYCPRCSLPYCSTRYCGEGDVHTPFRKHRGRWAPHQKWGREWYDVVARRAEALWYRATEDPYFGAPQHTQRQAEALLRVYTRAKQRGKAIDFMSRLRGSLEFLTGDITITTVMQESYDALLDTTPHPHLLTNGFTLESEAAKYTGEVNKAPLSPLQFRIDMEMNKYRRQQREEGVVRVPPALWRLDTSAIVPYKVDPQTRHIVNWREVKEGIEKSFLSVGLPKEAYTGDEWREMLYLHDVIANRESRAALLEQVQKLDREKLRVRQEVQSNSKKGGAKTSSGDTGIIFPDKEGYQVFFTDEASLQPFSIGASGTLFKAVSRVYASPTAVPYDDPVHKKQFLIDTTHEACRVFGGFEHGDRLLVRARSGRGCGAGRGNVSNGKGRDISNEEGEEEVVVMGVSAEGNDAERMLCGMYVDAEKQRERGIVLLGTDCIDIRERWETLRYVSPPHVKGRVTLLDSQLTAREEFIGQVVGVRDGVLFVQWRLLKGGGSALDRSVALPVGSATQVRELFVQTTVLGVEPLHPPPSWRTPFRNDFAEERLKELQLAPFKREKHVPLIQGRYTPKVKKFGYAQHTTVDDFETKEFKDRLLSKQYFQNPQAFEVVPDRRERSVQFGGKWEYQRTHGIPTVDRNELENGWSEVEPISDDELNVIEQALRDISGRRPGNFVKPPSKTKTLQLNEVWWEAFGYGWEEHNEKQKALCDATEQRLIDSSSLPFGGKLPPFGSSYGMGERMRAVIEDYSKGFGLGPHGHSPTHDTSHYNTLNAENERVRDLGYTDALGRLFNEKLGERDVYQWAAEWCADGEVDVRHLLLSLHEWRERGRPPSLLLENILSRYLEEEIAAFNKGVPENAPKLQLRTSDGTLAHSGNGGSRSGTVWLDVDPTAYALQRAGRDSRGTRRDEPFVLHLVKRAKLGDNIANLTDPAYIAHLEGCVVNDFQLALTKLVGKGISPTLLAQKTGQLHRGSVRAGGHVIPFVKSRELARLLERMGLTAESIAIVVRGLANCQEQESVGDDFAVPVSVILSWEGPGASGIGERRTNATSTRNEQQRRGSAALSNAIRQLGQQQKQRDGGSVRAWQKEDKMVVHVLEELALRNDGLVMDIQYAIRENKRNPKLRIEFLTALLPVFDGNVTRVEQLYTDYCDGKYVPNITVAVEAFIAFLHNVTQHPETYPASAYFEVDDGNGAITASSDDLPCVGQYITMKLLDPLEGPFIFDNVKVERIETVERFKRHGVRAGPVMAPATGFIAANCKSLNYFTRREDEVVYVTSDSDQGLQHSLERSAYYRVIAANPALQYLLKARRGAALVEAFNRFFYRTMPMLSFYQNVLRQYSATVQPLRQVAQSSARGLARALESERSAAMEEFRRNSERYWRNIIEGRSAEQVAMGSSEYNTKHIIGGIEQLQRNQSGGDTTAPSSGVGAPGGRKGAQRHHQQRQQSPSQQQQHPSPDAREQGTGRASLLPRSGGSRGMADLLSKLNTPKTAAKGKGRGTTPAGDAKRKPKT